MDITLRPFQISAIEQYRRVWDKAKSHIGIAPTAFGKSIFAGYMAHKLCRHGWRVVMIAHREALVEQNAKKALMVDPALVVAKEIAKERVGPADGVDFVSACIASLRGERAKRCISEWREDGRQILLITDECHHALADSYKNFLELLRPEKHLGLTATPFRGDGENLRSVFEEVGFQIDRGAMVDDGWLSNPHHFCVETTTSLAGVKTRLGDYVEKDLANTINTKTRNELVVNAANEASEILSSEQHGQAVARAVCFTASVDHAHKMAETFKDHGWEAYAVDGSTPIPDRRHVDDRLRTASGNVVACSCGVLTEGWDVEQINLGIFARPTKSAVLSEQMAGRVLRFLPDKKTCLLLDFQDQYSEGRQTLAMGWKLPPLWDCRGGSLREDQLWFAGQSKDLQLSTASKICGCVNRDEVERILRDPDAKTARTLDRCYLWWDLGVEWRMATNQGSIVVYMAPQGDFVSEWRRSGEVITVSTGSSLDAMCDESEMWLDQYYPDDARFMRGRERWQPPSDKQLAYMRRAGIPITEGITKYQASQLINEKRMQTNRSIEGGYVTFGKYRGFHVTELPTHYLRWCLSPDQKNMAHKPEYEMFKREMDRRIYQ